MLSSYIIKYPFFLCVQRKDYSVITKLLPPKYEYVISVRLSKKQMEMYKKYLELNVTHDPTNPNRVSKHFNYEYLL